MPLNGFHACCGLTEEQTTQLHHLAAVCREADGIDVKFNYGTIARREAGVDVDCCWFENGRLMGYAPLDRFGPKGEITAAVHPTLRKQHIFTQLYRAAVQQAKAIGCTELLLVNYRASESGSAVVKRFGLAYNTSEYCMNAAAVQILELPAADIDLIRVAADDVEELSGMLAISFPGTGWGTPKDLLAEMERPGNRYYLAYLSGQTIGHIGVSKGKDETYIRGVGILPEWRRKGYGRQMLAQTLRLLLAEGVERFELDVATDNENALNIYTACGFRQSNVYDYYTVFL